MGSSVLCEKLSKLAPRFAEVMGFKDRELDQLSKTKGRLQLELARGKTNAGRELTAEEKQQVWPGKLRLNEEKFKQREQDLVVIVCLCCFGEL